jgi:hypothetical protein
METLDQKISKLKKYITDLKYLEAIDDLYHDEIEVYENHNLACKGKSNYKQQGKDYIAGIENYKAELLKTLIGDQVTACLWKYSFDHKQRGPMNMEELSVQKWKDGKIISETHIY